MAFELLIQHINGWKPARSVWAVHCLVGATMSKLMAPDFERLARSDYPRLPWHRPAPGTSTRPLIARGPGQPAGLPETGLQILPRRWTRSYRRSGPPRSLPVVAGRRTDEGIHLFRRSARISSQP